MSRFFSLLIILTALAAAACVRPFGTIGGHPDYDGMWTTVYRNSYEVNDLFRRHVDLAVFAIYNGSVTAVPIDRAAISIIEDPDWSDEEFPVALDAHYPLLKDGRKEVLVRFGGMLNRYSIEVIDPFNIGTGGGGNEGGGIIVEWYD